MKVRLAGQDLQILHPLLELEPFKISNMVHGTADEAALFFNHRGFLQHCQSPAVSFAATYSATGWVAGAVRRVEVFDTGEEFILKVEGCGEYCIRPQAATIERLDPSPSRELNALDREVICGPALVLALALRGVWCLHASAAMFNAQVIIILGESGHGKSTLGAFLAANPGWSLVADDILPVTLEENRLTAWPHFPQLKLPIDSQPGLCLPEQLPLHAVCVLETVPDDAAPGLKRLPLSEAAETLLRHTAGTRMFAPAMLSEHLAFCARTAGLIQFSALDYPHRQEALEEVRELLENL